MKNKIIIGKIYMKSGNVIPFAALKNDVLQGLYYKENWDENGHRITSMKTTFVRYGEIERVNFISGSEVESITVDSTVTLTWFSKWWNNVT